MARDQAQGEAFGGKPKDMPAAAQAQAAEQDPWAQARHQYRQQAASQHYQDILAARRSGVLAQLAQSQTSGERQGGAPPSQERGMYAEARVGAEQRRDASLRSLQMLEAGGAQRGGLEAAQEDGAAQREAFLNERHAGPGALMAQAGGADGRWRVSAGTLIELVLETGLNSDVPGMVRGRVAAPVWDRTGKQVVIPTGSVLVGVFNARVQQGDERVQLAWTRLELPAGERIELGGQPGTELTGAAGVGAQVDRHLDEVFEGAILSSLFSVGAALTQGTTSAFSRTPEQAVSGAIAGEFNETGKELTRRAQGRAPTLTVPPGAHIGIMLKEDMIFR
jgi:type IV secretion system protein VirB10